MRGRMCSRTQRQHRCATSHGCSLAVLIGFLLADPIQSSSVAVLGMVHMILVLTTLSRHKDTSYLERARVSYELNVFVILPNLQTLLAVVCSCESNGIVEEWLDLYFLLSLGLRVSMPYLDACLCQYETVCSSYQHLSPIIADTLHLLKSQ